MANLWDADVEISESLAARLIDEQFPELAPATVEAFGVGWDNAAFRVNGRHVFRFPRRQVAVKLLEREGWTLPLLASHLPLPVPVPQFYGKPADDYPYPFSGYAHLPGTTVDRLTWTNAGRAANAAALGRFLSALHSVPVSDEVRAKAPGDDFERADLPGKARTMAERLATVTGLSDGEKDAILALADRLAGTPPFIGAPVWVHGDLYARHLLADERHQVCGVIDWGDAHLGDPALDLSIAWSFLPPEGRGSFRVAYGPIDAPAWDRARFRALFYGVVLLHYGQQADDSAIAGAGRDALRFALTDS